jgi:hypothetical protein
MKAVPKGEGLTGTAWFGLFLGIVDVFWDLLTPVNLGITLGADNLYPGFKCAAEILRILHSRSTDE